MAEQNYYGGEIIPNTAKSFNSTRHVCHLRNATLSVVNDPLTTVSQEKEKLSYGLVTQEKSKMRPTTTLLAKNNQSENTSKIH